MQENPHEHFTVLLMVATAVVFCLRGTYPQGGLVFGAFAVALATSMIHYAIIERNRKPIEPEKPYDDNWGRDSRFFNLK